MIALRRERKPTLTGCQSSAKSSCFGFYIQWQRWNKERNVSHSKLISWRKSNRTIADVAKHQLDCSCRIAEWEEIRRTSAFFGIKMWTSVIVVQSLWYLSVSRVWHCMFLSDLLGSVDHVWTSSQKQWLNSHARTHVFHFCSFFDHSIPKRPFVNRLFLSPCNEVPQFLNIKVNHHSRPSQLAV